MYGDINSQYMQQLQQNPQYNPYIRLQQLEQQQSMMLQQQQPQQQARGIDFVGGVDGAKGFNMPNNSSAVLMDNSDPVFYMVQVDGVGMRNIKAFRFEEIEVKPAQSQQFDASKFATKDDLQAILQQINELKGVVLNG